ncbi:restriction endonuclease subunit S [Carbonactinospora thermoautotrophica]|uniref:restriction endonuclease subunit S n=1 Tax=Carbonactinospora thermoautotrophica TaxID=1469144 RepID=UPI00099E5D20|nr:restriction endonuclease subunit S [Carbonactinospora thermoautotrophica]
MSELEYVALREFAVPGGLVGGPFGSKLVSTDYVPEGVPVIRGQNLASPGYFDASEFVFVSEEKVERDLSRNLAEPGDVVFTQRGTLGQVGIVPDAPFPRYVISQSQMRMRVDRRVAEPRYIYYCFRDPRMVQMIQARAITTGVPHINLGILAELPIPRRPLVEQRRIVEVLGALDDKIAVNERIARSCDELRALRFVDFIQSSPSKVIERPLSSFADFVNGRAFTKNATGTGRMVIRIAEINSGPGGSTVYNDIDVPDRHLARPGDVLFAWSGSLTVARWFRPEAIVNQHIFKVIPRDGLPNWLLFELIRTKLKKFQSIAADKATTMGHIQRRHLDEPVSAPADDVVSRLDSQLGPLWERALTAEQESLTLAALRDTLLPKLMSGEIRVRDAEKAVEEAL